MEERKGKLETLINDPELLTKTGMAGRERVIVRYSLKAKRAKDAENISVINVKRMRLLLSTKRSF